MATNTGHQAVRTVGLSIGRPSSVHSVTDPGPWERERRLRAYEYRVACDMWGAPIFPPALGGACCWLVASDRKNHRRIVIDEDGVRHALSWNYKRLAKPLKKGGCPKGRKRHGQGIGAITRQEATNGLGLEGYLDK